MPDEAQSKVAKQANRRLSTTRASFTRLITWLADMRMLKARAKKGTMAFENDAGATVGDPVQLRALPSQGESSSDSHGHKNDTHLLLDVRDPRIRFQDAARAVIKLQRTTGKRAAPVHPRMPCQGSWWQTPMQSDADTSASPVPDPGLYALRGARVAKVIEELKALEMAEELLPHGALVRHLQFSPSGKYLATAR